MKIAIDDRIDEFTLPSHDGGECTLSDLLSGVRGVFLIFLRHLT
jgi:hypothetical protein